MNILVNNCNNCPFSQILFSDNNILDALSASEICVLAKFKGREGFVINTYTDYVEECNVINHPEWCPLKEDKELNIKLIV